MGNQLNIQGTKTFMGASGQLGKTGTPFLYRKLTSDKYHEFLSACVEQEDVAAFNSCLDLVWVAISYMHSRGWDVPRGWAEIERSNLDKICPETLSVRHRSDGKILPPDGWKPPDLNFILEKLK
jgi:predicted HAD superfamily Cof-like phosphohydrolase